jgi:hypothetical protein
MANLEDILKSKGYISEAKLLSSTKQQQKKSVAFPQQSVLSYKGLTVGSDISSGIL